MEEDFTGFSHNETAQYLPGVLQGKRLTLDNINERLVQVEEVLAKLSTDFYSDAKQPPGVTNTTNTISFEEPFASRIKALQSANADLRAELDEKNKEISRLNDLVVARDNELGEAYDDIDRLYEKVRNRQ